MPAQPGARPMQSRLDCSHWHAQDSCSLLRGQLLHMKHMENLDVERPQSINRLSKQDTGLFERAFLLRIPSPLYRVKSGSSFSLNLSSSDASFFLRPVRNRMNAAFRAIRVSQEENRERPWKVSKWRRASRMSACT